LRKGLPYVDSNVFLFPVIYRAEDVEEARRAKSFLLKIARGEVEAYTSTITWDEVVWVIRKIFNFELSLEQGRRFLEFPNLKFLSVKKSTVFVAHKLLERYRLKPRDALHAAVAIENGLTEIVSYDRDFDVLKELKRIEP